MRQNALVNASDTTPPLHYFVSINGKNSSEHGSIDKPWETITFAIQHVEDGSTIWVLPGLYEGQVALTGSFQQGVVVRSCIPYQAQLRHKAAQVVICFTCQGVTLEGFDIAHSGPDAAVYVIQIQDSLGKVTNNAHHVSRVTLRNNVIHDSHNNDLLKLNNGARQVLIEGNMFYNQMGLDSHVDINGVTDVIVQENIFFNDFAGSGRKNENDTGSFIVVKDSNGSSDDILGASNIFIRRNLFLNWEGEPLGNSFISVGEDPVTYYQAYDVLIENNLMLGNSSNLMRAAIQIRGSRDITFRNNTISGDLPTLSYAVRLSRHELNPANKNILLYNNIWSDPSGTMGAEDPNDWRDSDFSDTNPEGIDSFDLSNNLYWNGGEPIYADSEELVNHTNDSAGIVANPRIPILIGPAAPRWISEQGHFADGSLTVRDVFMRMSAKYGVPKADRVVVVNASPDHSPTEDILGIPRNNSHPTIGAVEHMSIMNQ